MIDTAIIIAGGKGTRMHPVTGDRIPKALLPIFDRPVIVRQLDLLQRFHFRRCIISAGHLAQELQDALGHRHEDVALEYAVEPKPLGTAGGLALIANTLPNDFIVLYGDVACWFDLDAFTSAHRRYRSDATLVVHPNDHPFDSDFVEADEHGIITRLLPKKTRPPGDYQNLVSAAAYCLSHNALQHIAPDQKQDFVRDVFPRMHAAGQRLVAYSTTEYLKDTGTPERIQQVDAAYRAGMHEARFAGKPRAAVFLDRDGVINVERDHLRKVDDFELIEGSAAAIRKLNKAGFLVVVVTNQPGLAKGFFSPDDLAAIHRRMETALGAEGAYVDAIYHCPHHPERGFEGEVPALKIPCTCRKPQPGMLYRAAHELSIDLSRSVMIGDSFRDMEAASRAGVLPIGVRTGYGCKTVLGARHELTLFENLAEAASWLTEPDEQTDAMVAQLLANESNTRLVLIGGIARAGKSSLAARLTWRLREQGKRVLSVSLDDWIRGIDKRNDAAAANTTTMDEKTAGSNTTSNTDSSAISDAMAHHFGLSEAAHALKQLLSGHPVVSPGYEPQSRRRTAPRCYDPRGTDFIVADGNMALSETLARLSALRVYVEACPKQVSSRFMRFYAWKGLPAEQAVVLLEKRRNTEWPHVEHTRSAADTIWHHGRDTLAMTDADTMGAIPAP